MVEYVLSDLQARRAVVRRAGKPSLVELWRVANWHEDAASFVRGLDPDAVPERVTDALDEAWEVCSAVAARAQARTDLPYPQYYAAELGTLVALYALVRLRAPEVVVESGVANGLSTEVILHALERSGRGELHSVDIAAGVGPLVTNGGRWTLHVIDPEDDGAFPSIVQALPRVDVFFHDGDHSHRGQTLEYTTVWPRLADGGLLLSDDVDLSYAFLDFVGALGLPCAMLLARRKVTGAVARVGGCSPEGVEIRAAE